MNGNTKIQPTEHDLWIHCLPNHGVIVDATMARNPLVFKTTNEFFLAFDQFVYGKDGPISDIIRAGVNYQEKKEREKNAKRQREA